MEKYIVKYNQNIYDIAITLYGTVEGVFQIIAYNPNISFDTQFKAGDVIEWDGNHKSYNNLVNTIVKEGVVAANGERNIFYKETNEDPKIYIMVAENMKYLELDITGDGYMMIDWDDNSAIERIDLSANMSKVYHYFDTKTTKRRVVIYGNFNVKTWNWSKTYGNILPLVPIVMDEIKIDKNNMMLEGLFLCKDTYSIILANRLISSLDPIRDMNLQYLSLKGNQYIVPSCVDDYLIYLARNNNQRRNCRVEMDVLPSGEYEQPPKDEYGNYIITTGMQAIYVILHEPAWNAAGPWSFVINGKEYSASNLHFDYKLSFIVQ